MIAFKQQIWKSMAESSGKHHLDIGQFHFWEGAMLYGDTVANTFLNVRTTVETKNQTKGFNV